MRSVLKGRDGAGTTDRRSPGSASVNGRRGISGWSTILPVDVPIPPADDPVPEPQSVAGDLTRVQVQVVTTSRRTAVVELRVRLDTVEAWFEECLRGVFDRVRLRAWLAAPSGWLGAGDVVFSVDPRSRGERIAISLSEVLAWTLSPEELRGLRERV